ncbi:single-strand DNA-binding protein [Naumannella cuiyingiana]|uniref:Single-strand DNA-binding protein n=1 Tax=Naumannella cuiyingiana TaxID=1347891 RepID=A0A7Z0DBT6_9ACTN|nr:single-stranded DNA-binding protein [Naumannella cuiyingiana]NYI72715.1 single-strand DNA-binding protein [Naumannella cuiyingiana]
MSTISRTGNLAAAPELRQGESGPYTYARVIVTDRIRQADDSWTDGPAIAYNVAVSGSQAENLVAAAESGGNIRVTFTGTYRVTEYVDNEGGTRIQHEVRATDIGASFRGQRVQVVRPGGTS